MKSTKIDKKQFPKTIYVENFGTKKHPNVSAYHELDEYLVYNPMDTEKPTILARYELVEVGTIETTTKFKATD